MCVTPPTATVRLFATPAAHVPVMVGMALSALDISIVGAVKTGAGGGGGGGGGGGETMIASFCVSLVSLPTASVSTRFKSYFPGANCSVGTNVNTPCPSEINSLSLPNA